MRLEDYQSYYQPVFSRPVKIVIGILVVLILFTPINIAPLEQRLYSGVSSVYTAMVDSPQEFVETCLVNKLNLPLAYNETNPARILQKQQSQGWLLKNWFFWGPFFVFMFPLSLLCWIGFLRKIKSILSRNRLLESYEGALLWEIRDKIRRVSWRVNFFNWEKAFIYALIMGLILFTGQFAAQYFVNLSQKIMQSLLLSFLIYTTGIYTFYLYYKRVSQKQVIGIIDNRMGLKERLVTSMEEPRFPTPLYSVVLEETSQELRQQDMETLAPHRFPRPSKKGLLGMLLSTILLAILISAATPHAAILAKSYQNYVREFSPRKKKQEIKGIDKIIRQEGKVLKELVDELESDSDDVKFFLEETRHLAQQMSSFDVDKMNISIKPSQPSNSNSLSNVAFPEDSQQKKVKKKRKKFEKEVKISERSLSIEAYQHHQWNDQDFSQISGELSNIAMEMIKKRKSIPNNHKSPWRKTFLRKDLINNFQGNEEVHADNIDDDTDDSGSEDDNIDNVDDFIEGDSFGEGETDTFLKEQKEGESNTFSPKSPSRARAEKKQLHEQKIDIKTLKSIMESIFTTMEEKQQVTKENKGEQVKQKNIPEQQVKAELKEKSVNELLNQAPSITRRYKPQNQQENKHSRTKPSAYDKTLYVSPTKTKKKTTLPQSKEQRSVREFSTNHLKRKNVVILDNPRNIEIAKETFEDIPDEYADWYLEEWINDSQGALPSLTNAPVREDDERSVVLGKKADILYKNFLVINNPGNIKNPRPEMRDAVASVDTPYFIRGLPKKLSHFVKDVTNPQKIEVFSSQLNKLAKDLDDWERANAAKTARYRSGMSQQKATAIQANWTGDKAEIGGRNPMGNKEATVIRGSKINRSADDFSKKIRVDQFPEHLSPHQNLTNISQDLGNLGRELTDIEGMQRQALLGRKETSGDSISTDNRKDNRSKFKERLNKMGNQFEGLGNKIEQVSDLEALEVFATRMAKQSRHLGNMLLGFARSSDSRGTTRSTKVNKRVQNTLQENKKILQDMAEQIRDREFPGYDSNLSSRLAHLANKTGSLAGQPGLSESDDPVADDSIRKSLLQKAASIEQLTEDLRQRNPKNNSEMARRFSKLAREMDNLNQGLEKGKAIGKESGIDTVRKGLQQKGKRIELLSEDIKQGKEPMGIKEMASQLSQVTEEMVDLQERLNRPIGKQPTFNKSRNKLSRLKDIDRKIQQQTAPQQLQKLANQMGETALDIKFSLDAQTTTSQELDKTDRLRAGKLGKEFLQLSEKMQQKTSVEELRKLAGQMTDASQEMRNIKDRSQVSTKDEKIPEQLKQTANQLTELAQYAKDKNFNLDKLVRNVDKSSKQLDRLLAQSKDMQQKYASKIGKVAGKLEMIRQELKGLENNDSRQEFMTQQTREYIKKQKNQLKDMAYRIQQEPADLSPVAKKLQEISKEIGRTAADGKKESDKNASNRLNKSASQIKKLAGDMKQAAETQKIPVSELVKVSQEAMQDTMKRIEEINKKISDDPTQARQKGKELAALSEEMEKLSRLQSLLGVDQTATIKRQQEIKKARYDLQKLSKELQRQTDTKKIRALSQKTQQVSKDLIALSKNRSTFDQPDSSVSSARRLKKMAEQLSKNKNVTTARSLSRGLDDIIRQLNPGNRSDSSRLGKVKENLDKLITKIEYDRRQETDQEEQQNILSQNIMDISQKILQEDNPRKIEALSSQLTQLANKMGNQIQEENNDAPGTLNGNLRQMLTKTQKSVNRLSEKIKKGQNTREIKKEAKELNRRADKTADLMLMEKKRNAKDRKLLKSMEKTVRRVRKISRKIQDEKESQSLKKYTTELDNITEQMITMTMGMKDGSGKRSLKETIRELVKNTGESLQEITRRLDENIEVDKISSDLMELSEELSNLDLGATKKTDSEENITESDKKIIHEAGNKLKELSDKAKSQKNPKDVRQMATDLLKLTGNLKNLDMGKSEQQGTQSISTVVGQNRNFRANKLKQIARRLKTTSNVSETKIIASQMSKLISNLGKYNIKRTYKTTGADKNKRQENSGNFFKKILDLPQFFRQDKNIKEEKSKSTKARDQKDMTRTAAVNKIDKLIKKLKRRKKTLPGVYNSKRVLKKAGVSSKGAGTVQKGVVGKMTRSNYNKAKFTDSNVSKDVNILPNADIINNTYVMEKNLTDRQVFERIIHRLEKNREHILAEGQDPNETMPDRKTPLSEDYQPTHHDPGKQPIKGNNSRMLAGVGIPDTVKIPGAPPVEEKRQLKIPDKSYMEKRKHTESMKMSVRLDTEDTSNIPKDRLKKKTRQESSQFNEFQTKDDSVIGQNVPGEYQDIINELYSQ